MTSFCVNRILLQYSQPDLGTHRYKVPSVLHGASSVPRNLDTITASEETVAGKRVPLTRKGPPSSVKRAGSVATNPARRNSLIRHSTSANLARAFFWNRSKEVSSTPDNSTLALNKARSLMIQLLTPQLSLKDNKALLDLATLCWLGGKGVQDFVGREGGLNEISRLLEERVRGFSSSEQEVPASPKRPAARGRRRRLSFDSIKTSPQLIKRSAKSPKVGADLVVAALSLLETLCRGHEKNQKEILRLGYIGGCCNHEILHLHVFLSVQMCS